MSYTQNLGKVSVVAKGTWNNAATYERLDIVKYNGGSYIAIQDVPTGRSVTDTDYWMALADKGDQGEAGNGIASIVRTASIGLVDYYTITYTDGTTAAMNIRNGEKGEKGDDGNDGDDGNGIASVELLSTSGIAKTYRMTFTDGTYFDYVVNDGETNLSNAVRFDTAQEKTDAEKATAQNNIGLVGTVNETKVTLGNNVAPNATGNNNTGIGKNALSQNTSGGNNTAVGMGAGSAITTGQNNTIIGSNANTSAAGTNLGTAVGRMSKTGADSAAVGANANASGAYGTAVGFRAEATASRGTAIGADAKANFAGSVAIGVDSNGNGATASAQNEVAIGTASHKIKIAGTQYDGTFKASVPNPTFGSELNSDLSAWTGTNATFTNNQWEISSGGTINSTIQCEADADYLIKLTVNNAVTPNDVLQPCAISLGDASISIFGANDANWQVILTPTSSGNLSITIGGGTWRGNISGVSVKKITAYANAALNVQDKYIAMPSSSVVVGNGFAKQGITSANNVAIGYHAQENTQSGIGNVGIGLYAQQNVKNGSHNVAVGESAQRALTTGMYNFSVGYSAQSKLTSGCWNVAFGNEASRDLTDGCNNVSVGRRAHNSMTHGNKNIAIGAQSGFVRNINGNNTASVATITAEEQVLIGFQATQKTSTQADGAIAIGARAASETDAIAIGRDTSAGANGSVAIGRDSSGNSAHADNANDFVLGTSNHRFILGDKVISFNQDGTVTWNALE